MVLEEVYDQLALALKRSEEARRNSEKELISLKAQLEALVEVLIGRQVLTAGHRRHLSKVALHSTQPGSRVRLRLYVDKYSLPPAEPIDCAALLHLCKGRCCTLTVELTTQDVDEGRVRWDVLDPYVLRREVDGRCTHQDRQTLGCTMYENRPATCRV